MKYLGPYETYHEILKLASIYILSCTAIVQRRIQLKMVVN